MEEEKNSNVDVNEDAFTPSDSKEKKGGIKVVLGIVIFLVVIALVAGATYFAMLKAEESSARKTVEGVFESLKTGDEEAIDRYLNNGEGSIAEEDDTFMLFFQPLNYDIKNVEADFKNASVEVEVSTKDTGEIFKNYFAKIYEIAFSNALSGNVSEEDLDNQLKSYLQEQVTSEEIETITNTITLRLEKDGTEWKVSEDDENVDAFVNAVLPNFSSVLEDLQSSMNQ